MMYDRELAPAVVEALHESGLFRLLIPRELEGGAKLIWRHLWRRSKPFAQADGSAGWCAAQVSGGSLTSAYLRAKQPGKYSVPTHARCLPGGLDPVAGRNAATAAGESQAIGVTRAVGAMPIGWAASVRCLRRTAHRYSIRMARRWCAPLCFPKPRLRCLMTGTLWAYALDAHVPV